MLASVGFRASPWLWQLQSRALVRVALAHWTGRDMEMLTLALPKGRVLREALPLLASVGIKPLQDPETSRKLIIDASDSNMRLLVVRATDVPTYVQYGAADLGIVGKDVLMEHGAHGLYEPLDLGVARCRLVVAALPEHHPGPGRLRVATKFVRVARGYFAEQGRQVDVIKLYGSMELAPLVGLCDCIVDLVDTGNTLAANGLEQREIIAHISSRLIVNRAAMKIKHRRVRQIVSELAHAVTGGADASRKEWPKESAYARVEH